MTESRVAVFDEFPADTFLLEFDGDTVTSAMSAYLSRQDGIPFDDFTELIEGRNSSRGEEARDWLDTDDLERDGEPVLKDASSSTNACAPLLTTQSSSEETSPMGGNVLTSLKKQVSALNEG